MGSTGEGGDFGGSQRTTKRNSFFSFYCMCLGIEHRSSGLETAIPLSAGLVFLFLIGPHVAQADLYFNM